MLIGERIRRKRLALEIGQDEVARRIGVGQPTVSKWERGGPIDRRHYAAIAKFLDATEAEVGRMAYEDESEVKDLRSEIEELRLTVADLESTVADLESRLQPPGSAQGD